MKGNIYQLLREAVMVNYQEDFVNCFFNKICQPICGVQCNKHYIEGPTHVNMVGCFVMQFEAVEARKFLEDFFSKVDNGYMWDDGWKKI